MWSKQKNLVFLNREECLKDFSACARSGEFRFIDHLQKPNDAAKFQILGIHECVGPLANYGRSGAQFAFSAFLKYFLPTSFQGESVNLMGAIQYIGPTNPTVEQASELVSELDDFLLNILLDKIGAGQIPLIIGGGHNNALALMRWAQKSRNNSSVINIDAHADCRDVVHRHSGNSFSTALDQGTISNYSVLGLHTYYLNSHIEAYLKRKDVFHTLYESYLNGDQNLLSDFKFEANRYDSYGFELDLDAIQMMPSSALSPSGWNLDQIRGIVRAKELEKAVYVNLTEGAPMDEKEQRIVGKALMYLVRDLIQIKE